MGDQTRARVGALIVAGLLIAIVLPVSPASAHGHDIDQQLSGTPSCSENPVTGESDFPGFVLTTQELRQQFVPSVGGVTSVDLCLKILTPSTTLTLNIWREGDGGIKGSDPGDLLRSKTITVPNTGFTWVPVPIDPELELTPGVKHILEIPPTQVTFQWRAACGTTLQPCSRSVDPYTKGVTNFHPDIVDFGFRTRQARLPDLTGTISVPRVVCPGQTFGDTLRGSVSNNGQVSSAPTTASVYLSPDQTITSDDVRIHTAQVPTLAAGARANLALGDVRVPATLPAELQPDRRAYMGLIVDGSNEVSEANEGNNVTAARLALTACTHASVSDLSVNVNRSETVPGAFSVPLDKIEVGDLPIAGEDSATLSSFDVESTPLRPIDLTSLFDDAPRSALDSILLSSIPYCCWREILDAAGSPFAGQPLHAVTLWDVLNMDPAPSISLQDADLGGSGLKGLTAFGVLSAGTPLQALDPDEPWCGTLGTSGFDCGTRFNPATDDVLKLNLLGFRGIRWSQLPPIAEMSLNSSSPLMTTPLRGSSSTDHFQISQTPYREVLVSSLSDANAIIACSALPNGCGAGSPDTLGTVAEEDAFRSGATFGQLLSRMPDGSTISFGEAALGIFQREDLAWEALEYQRFRPQDAESFGDPLIYTVSFKNDSTVTMVDPTIDLLLPHNFVAAGSITAPAGIDAAAPVAIGDTIRFTTEAFIAPGATVSFGIPVHPWVRLGTFKTGAKVSWVDAGAAAPDHPHDAQVTGQAPVRVVDVERDIPNDEPIAAGAGAAPQLEPNELVFTTIGPDDEDFFVIPAQPAGSRVRLTMVSTAPADVEPDFDLALYKLTSGGIDSLPLRPIDLTSLPVEDDGWEVNSTGTRVSPEALEDLPLRPIDLTSLSVHRESSRESMTVTVGSGDGPLIVHLFGYNGAFSNDPVVLRAKVTGPAELGPCTATPAPEEGVRATQLTWLPTGKLPSDVDTLFVFDQDRTGDLYGAGEAGEVRESLRSLAARTDLGITGAVLSVDADPRPPVPSDPSSTVPTARAATEADPCDVRASNDLVSAITSLMADARATMPNIDSVVIVGNNNVIPHHFSRDFTWKSNEVDNISDMLAATGNTVMTTAMATRHFATDSPYGAKDSLPFLGERVYPPAFELGRLSAETADGIVAHVQRYITAGGVIDPARATVASIDVLSDGADAVADSLASRLDVTVNRLDDEPTDTADGWTAGDLRNATTQASPAPDVVSLGGHATHDALLASKGGGTIGATEIATSTLPPGLLAVSNGCHFGLNLPDTALTGSAPDWTGELMAKGAAAVVGSTGFAYADRSGVAYSEELLQRFAGWLGGGRTIGSSWKGAIDEYIDALLGVDAFDHKTLGEFVVNGLPHWRVAGPATPEPTVPHVAGPVAPDATGLQAAPIDLSFDPNDAKSERHDTPQGSYYTWDGDMEAKNGFPIVARFVGDVAKPGLHAQDIFVTSMNTVVEANDPVFAGAIVGSKERNEIQSGDAISPSLPVRVSPTGNAVFRLGRFRSTGVEDGQVVGNLSRLTALKGSVYFGSGGERPRFRRIETEVVNAGGVSEIRFSARLAPTVTPLKMNVVFRDLEGWHTANFRRSTADANTWTAEAPLSGTVLLDALFQALGPTGKVGATLLKGADVTLRRLIQIEGERGDNGWFRDAVTVSLGTDPEVTYEYSLNNATPPREYTGPFTVSGDGIHELEVWGSDLSSDRVIIPIDSSPPTIDVTVPTNNAEYRFQDPVSLAFSCDDTVSGIATCSAALDGAAIANGASLTTRSGPHTLVVTATDAAGRTASVTRTFSVTGYTYNGFLEPVEKKPPLLNQRKAGDSVPLKWEVFAPNGVELTSLDIVTGVKVGSIDCAAPANTSRWGSLADAVSNPPLRYGGHYTFNAQTDKTSGGTCSRYVAQHNDGSSLLVFVKHTG